MPSRGFRPAKNLICTDELILYSLKYPTVYYIAISSLDCTPTKNVFCGKLKVSGRKHSVHQLFPVSVFRCYVIHFRLQDARPPFRAKLTFDFMVVISLTQFKSATMILLSVSCWLLQECSWTCDRALLDKNFLLWSFYICQENHIILTADVHFINIVGEMWRTRWNCN